MESTLQYRNVLYQHVHITFAQSCMSSIFQLKKGWKKSIGNNDEKRYLFIYFFEQARLVLEIYVARMI